MEPKHDTEDSDAFFGACYDRGGQGLKDAWEKHGEGLVAEWIEAHPGTRPFQFWKQPDPEPGTRVRPMGPTESQASYLRRRGWLAPGELKRIPPRAFDNVTPEPDPRRALLERGLQRRGSCGRAA